MSDLDSLLVLNAIPGLGNARIRKLLDHFGSAQRVLSANSDDLAAVQGLPMSVIQNIQHFPKDSYLKKEYNFVTAQKVRVLTYQDSCYPRRLNEIPDAPVILYVKGKAACLTEPAVAVVGSRHASLYGMTIAEKFSSDLCRAGVNIVSGLARGIDTSSHQGALKAGGTTIAVLGCGLARVYPPENKKLADMVEMNGALVSEFAMQTPPIARHFPMRNRIISGLSLGVVVVEASEKSGALITSNFALEQGREVFAVPGKVDQPNARGVNRLIKEGAKLVSCVEDILEELKLPLKNYLNEAHQNQPVFKKKNTQDWPEEESKIYQILGDEPVHIDDLSAGCGIPLPQLMTGLLRLEMRKAVKQLPGKLFVRS